MKIHSLKKLQNILFDEEKTIEFIFEKDLIHKPKYCSNCNNKEFSRYKKLFRCKNKDCKKAVSILKNSFFEKSKMQICDILLLGYLWLNKVKYTSISLMTDQSHNIIVKYIKIFRDLIIKTLKEDDMIIGGKDIIVEIDESKFKKNEDFWIVGGIERTEKKKCFFVIANDRSQQTLKKIIKKHVRPETMIYTDSWKGYFHLEELGMKHKRVNHSKTHVEYHGNIHTNHIEGTWAGIKLQISKRNRNINLIEKHLLEFVWRNKHRDKLFEAFLDAIKSSKQFNY
jgi:transposase-like protein